MAKVNAPSAPATAPERKLTENTNPNPPSAAPGTPDAAGQKSKKEKKAKRALYPGLWDATNETRLKLKEIPSDHDAKKHKPLGRKDFEDESLFYEIRARRCDAQAAKFREMAADSKLAGGTGEKAKAKRLIMMQKKMAELMAALKDSGVDVDALLAAANAT